MIVKFDFEIKPKKRLKQGIYYFMSEENKMILTCIMLNRLSYAGLIFSLHTETLSINAYAVRLDAAINHQPKLDRILMSAGM